MGWIPRAPETKIRDGYLAHRSLRHHSKLSMRFLQTPFSIKSPKHLKISNTFANKMETECGGYHALLRLGFEMDISPVQVPSINQNISNQSNSFLASVRLILKPLSQTKGIVFQDDAKKSFIHLNV